MLAQAAAHAGMAGKTAMMVAYILGDFCHVPLDKIQGRKHVDIHGARFQSMLSNVGQPLCLSCAHK
jgi:6-phosphofructokinase 1